MAYERKYYNPVKSRQYYLEHRDEICERQRAYRARRASEMTEEDKQREREYMVLYRRAKGINESLRPYMREYYRAHKEILKRKREEKKRTQNEIQ